MRTRAKLIAVFVEFADSGSVNRVSVADVVRAAHVNRSTFYEHFGSIGELGLAAVQPQLLATLERMHHMVVDHPEVPTRPLLECFVEHVVSMWKIYAELLVAPLTGAVCVDVISTVQAQAERTLAEISDRLPTGLRPEVVAPLFVNGALAVIGSWLNGRIDADTDTIVTEILAAFGVADERHIM